MFDTLPATRRSPQPALTSGEDRRARALFLGDPETCPRLRQACADLGLAVEDARDLADARQRINPEGVSLLVVSPLSGGETDFSACLELSRLRAAPVLVFSDRDNTTDRILALELGADDWIASTCCDRELAARLKAAMRRASGSPVAQADEIRIGSWRLNRSTGEARHDAGARSVLSKSELIILNLFVRNIGAVIGRREIRNALGVDPSDRDTGVNVHVFRLRKKLAAGTESLIRTIRGVGYVMDGPVTQA